MRLIDADVLRSLMNDRYIEKKLTVPDNLAEGFVQVEKLINEQQIAYDPEKVVKQIHDYFKKVIDDYEGEEITDEILIYNKDICEIVRNGGVK